MRIEGNLGALAVTPVVAAGAQLNAPVARTSGVGPIELPHRPTLEAWATGPPSPQPSPSRARGFDAGWGRVRSARGDARCGGGRSIEHPLARPSGVGPIERLHRPMLEAWATGHDQLPLPEGEGRGEEVFEPARILAQPAPACAQPRRSNSPLSAACRASSAQRCDSITSRALRALPGLPAIAARKSPIRVPWTSAGLI